MDPANNTFPSYSRKPAHCRLCGGSIATIMYGYPAMTEKLQEQIESGKTALGGCCVEQDLPDWICNQCHQTYFKSSKTLSR